MHGRTLRPNLQQEHRLADPVLAHERVTAPDAEARHWLFVLHGIFGAGRNWGSVARRVVRQRPEWGALLVDLRQHGASQGFAPPHTIQAAAADLDRLAQHTGIAPAAVLGHSFGGKVALLYATLTSAAPRQVWVIDATPEVRAPSGSAWAMLTLLEMMPDHFRTRAELVDALVSHRVAPAVAQWMATNLEAHDAGYRWRFDLHSLRELLLSFFAADAWHTVEHPPGDCEIHLVKAEESSVLSGETLERVARAAAASPGTHLHRVAGGHWVNAENPGAVESLLVQMLPA